MSALNDTPRLYVIRSEDRAPVARTRYERGPWLPAPGLGFKVGGSIACLVPLAYALAQLLGGAA